MPWTSGRPIGGLAEKLQERAPARGIKPYLDARGVRARPGQRPRQFHRKRAVHRIEEVLADEMLRDSARHRHPPGQTRASRTSASKGYYRWQGLGIQPAR